MSHAVLAEQLSHPVQTKHPLGGPFKSVCKVCKYLISPYNSARYCHCNIYSHGSCIAFTMDGCSPDERQHCELCKAPYNLYFAHKSALRPLSQMTILKALSLVFWAGLIPLICLTLIEMIDHSIENDTVTQELSYFLFSVIMALFVLTTLACFSKIILYKACTVVAVEPYYRTVISFESEQTSNGQLNGDIQINQTEALTTKQLVRIQI